MQEIADEAGINKAMLHYCFKTNNFFWSSVHECLQPIVAPNQYYFNSDASVFWKITKFTYDYITFVIDNPYLPPFVIQEMNNNPELSWN
jgi:AcrR family transcriptional regulator